LFVTVAWPILVRWALWRDLAAAPEEWRRDAEAVRLPGARAVVASIAALLLVAVPFFFALPRLKTPFARGFTGPSQEIWTGFTESVDPDTFGMLKRSDKVFIRITAERVLNERDLATLRLRTLAFTRYENRTWRRAERYGRAASSPPGVYLDLVSPARVNPAERTTLTLDLTPISSRFVPYPEHAVALKFFDTTYRATTNWWAERDDRGNVRLPFEPEHLIQYEALAGGTVVPNLVPPSSAEGSSKRFGKSDRVEALAREWTTGIDPAREPERAAQRIEAALSTKMSYSLEVPRAGPNPVDEFLFERKKGHCEDFATAMTCLLREVGIPARFVTGFAGGEIGLFGRYLIVRGRDSHAWVEAWCGPERGWIAFDPTPPSGRPEFVRVPWSQRFRQTVDAVELFYDRHVLGFSQGDQVELAKTVREAAATAAEAARDGWDSVKKTAASRKGRATIAGAVTFMVLLVGLLLFGRRKGGRIAFAFGPRSLPPATAIYRKLQKTLRRAGTKLDDASAPRETLSAAESFGNAAKRASAEIIKAYLAESFGGIELSAKESERLTSLLGEVKQAIAE
ncbi:MAG TPA: DUF3488 and transglutaminase-like domain-containing protein, partial [Thermoanaerobaculia bacterium]|nr:DUF3488 and transglutaminase-like domain-containing protein [Thermoanaerobaculia bacterium]